MTLWEKCKKRHSPLLPCHFLIPTPIPPPACSCVINVECLGKCFSKIDKSNLFRALTRKYSWFLYQRPFCQCRSANSPIYRWTEVITINILFQWHYQKSTQCNGLFHINLLRKYFENIIQTNTFSMRQRIAIGGTRLASSTKLYL